MRCYLVKGQIALPGLAKSRYQDLNRREAERGFRVIGGDLGDVRFEGYTLNRKKDVTVLRSPQLCSRLQLRPGEVTRKAKDIVSEAFDSIGLEAVE